MFTAESGAMGDFAGILLHFPTTAKNIFIRNRFSSQIWKGHLYTARKKKNSL